MFSAKNLNPAILAILLLATALLFYGLATDGLWGDEIFTAIFSSQSPAETIAFTASDIHPPLYYLVAGLLSHTSLWPAGSPGPVSDWLWRWPSVMLGVLTVAATYRLGTLLLNRRVGLLAAFLLALAPVAIKYGQEARMHAMFMMFSALSTLLLALALKSNRRKWWIGYLIATIFNMYTMYFAFIIIAVHGAWVLTVSLQQGVKPKALLRPWSAFFQWFLAILLACIAYLFWWPILFDILSYRAQVGAVEGGVGNPLAFLPKVVQSIGPFGGGAWLFFALYLGGLFAAFKRDRSLAVLGALWVALPALLPLALGDSRALHLRYAFVLPVFLIFVALAVEALTSLLKPSAQKWAWGLSVALLALLSLWGTGIVYRQHKPDWRGAARFIAQQAGPADVIVTGPLWDDQRFFSYYYPAPERVITPPTLAFRLPGIAAEMAEGDGRLWLVTRYTPEMDDFVAHEFNGVTALEQTRPEYDPVRIIDIGAELCKKAARSAYEWAELMEAGGVLNPDPRSSQAAAYRCQGDTYAVSGDYVRAVEPYEKMVAAFPGWAGGYALLAKSYMAVDNLPAAVEAFAQAVALNPAWQTAQAEQAAQMAAQGQLVEAAALYDSFIE